MKYAILSLLVVGSASFTPNAEPSRAPVRMETQRKPNIDVGLGRFFGMVATVSALSFGTVPAAQASQPQSQSLSAFSSSLEIADSIKTLDMSMPSYNDISSAKASVDDRKGLYVDPLTGKPAPKTMKVPLSASSSKGRNPVGSMLPSMNKQSAAAKQAEEAKPKTGVPEYNF